ncbi:MAG: acyl carrier protein [Ruminococcaceae bacterium]|nr:acyl carrier protein [Oscillospiraceae bacterium]
MEKLIKILEEIKPDVDFKKEKDLASSGILNSLAIISIIAAVSDEYGVQIPFTEMVPENFESAEAIYNMIVRVQNA